MKQRANAKERILDTATRLFYEQGFQATGINQIIEEAGIAKASLYQHFKSKDDLLLEYLTINDLRWFEDLREFLQTKTAGRAAILGLFDYRRKMASASDLKGCAFIRVAYELPLLADNALRIIQNHKSKLKDFIRSNIEVLNNHSHKESEELTELILNLYEGCGIQSTLLRSVAPIVAAKRIAGKLLK